MNPATETRRKLLADGYKFIREGDSDLTIMASIESKFVAGMTHGEFGVFIPNGQARRQEIAK